MSEKGKERHSLKLRWLGGRFAIARLAPGAAIPGWVSGAAPLLSITRTEDELSILAPQNLVPMGYRSERDFVALRIVGTLDFSMVGVLAKLTGALAEAGVSVVAVSTFDTDYLLVRAEDQQCAQQALTTVAYFID